MVWKDIGKRVASLRQNRGLTQEGFGHLIGVTRQYVSRIERGSKLSAEMIADICKKLGVSMDYVVFGIGEPLGILEFPSDLSYEQVVICLDIVKRFAAFVNTEKGNEALLQETMRRSMIRT